MQGEREVERAVGWAQFQVDGHRRERLGRVQRARFTSRFFFFSSRRRHTRCSRDWSSDVCSSDLKYTAATPSSSRYPMIRAASSKVNLRLTWRRYVEVGIITCRPYAADLSASQRAIRSEERRVGKECRSRWSRYHEKKK